MAKFQDEFFKQSDPIHDDLVACIIEGVNEIAELLEIKAHNDDEISIETENICKSGNGFIIGYPDIVLTDCTPRYVIDAKPKLTDFGAVTRQIKTYQELLRVQKRGSINMAIVTHSEPTRAAQVIAKNEGIALIVHDKETGRFSLAAEQPKNNNAQATLEAAV